MVGSGDDCVEQFARLRDDAGVDSVVVTLMNLPQELGARKEHAQRFAESVIHRTS